MKERLNIQRRNVDLVDLTFFKQIIDSLIWLTSIRPDIVYDVSLLNNLGITKQSHLQAANMILRHLKGHYLMAYSIRTEKKLSSYIGAFH